MTNSKVAVSVAIPTYGREHVLLQTIDALLGQIPKPAELLVIDQTQHHEPETEAQLQKCVSDGLIRWIRLNKPSIPAAMNKALVSAKQEIVLFLDDDIVSAEGLIAAHFRNYADPDIWGVAGQVLQPGQTVESVDTVYEPDNPDKDIRFPFNSNKKRFISSCMAGNLSVRRDRALQIGGFDENFVGDAYRFELEFCRRMVRNGGRILFDPKATIRHLQVRTGGTRAYGGHLTSSRADLTSGEYYFTLLEYSGMARVRGIFRRLLAALGRKFYLRRPWWLPVKFVAEVRGLLLAASLKRRGPAYIRPDGKSSFS